MGKNTHKTQGRKTITVRLRFALTQHRTAKPAGPLYLFTIGTLRVFNDCFVFTGYDISINKVIIQLKFASGGSAGGQTFDKHALKSMSPNAWLTNRLWCYATKTLIYGTFSISDPPGASWRFFWKVKQTGL